MFRSDNGATLASDRARLLWVPRFGDGFEGICIVAMDSGIQGHRRVVATWSTRFSPNAVLDG
jgi:hypothetical protein